MRKTRLGFGIISVLCSTLCIANFSFAVTADTFCAGRIPTQTEICKQASARFAAGVFGTHGCWYLGYDRTAFTASAKAQSACTRTENSSACIDGETFLYDCDWN